jgi:flagellar biosynthesis/type III secretory pathway M-ring protein FliF/YscJ
VRPIAVLGIVALFLLVVVRPVLGRTLKVGGGSAAGRDVEVGMPQQLPRTVEEIEQEIEQQLDSVPAEGDRRQPVLTRRVSRLAEKEPESAAKLVRGWLNDGKVARS